jgi:peptidoglycan/LPS O-acetylase OafA/YrhL
MSVIEDQAVRRPTFASGSDAQRRAAGEAIQGPDWSYRADIDGLRAVAVMLVVCFHAFPSFLKGGFIGVDVFFVISGFLISGMIFADLELGRFHFSTFYARRIRRIFPALLLTLSASFAFAWFVLFAVEYQQLGKHIAASAGFVANLIFQREIGYFDTAAETKPLLHLWSLGVEEQFYIIWPFLAWIVWRRSSAVLLVILSLGIVSFAINVAWMPSDAAFYSPLTRFWELMLGSGLAYFTSRQKRVFAEDLPPRMRRASTVMPRSVARFFKAARVCGDVEAPGTLGPGTAPRGGSLILARLAAERWNATAARPETRGIQSVVGLILIATGVGMFRDQNFPGWWALLPTIGTVLLIAAGPSAWLNRKLLSRRAIVFCGVISYPIYLWHWPLLSYASIIEGNFPSLQTRLAALLASACLACLTFLLIERPIRFGARKGQRTVVLIALMGFVGFAGYIVFARAGFPWRAVAQINQSIEQDLSVPTASRMSDDSCLKLLDIHPADDETCLVRGANPKYLLVGDSTAMAFNSAVAAGVSNLATALTATHAHIWSSRECLREMSFESWLTQQETCSLLLQHAFKIIAEKSSISAVLISFSAGDPFFFNLQKMSALQQAFLGLKKKVVYLVDVPNLKAHPASCSPRRLEFMHLEGLANYCSEPREALERQQARYREQVNSLKSRNPDVLVYDTWAALCDRKACSAGDDQGILYWVSGHVNVRGSALILRDFVNWAEQNLQQ